MRCTENGRWFGVLEDAAGNRPTGSIRENRMMAGFWPALAAFTLLATNSVGQVHGQELSGHWVCPAQLQLVAVGQSQLNLQLDTQSHLREDGRYESSGDATVQFGMWPLALNAVSRGEWRRDRQQLTFTVEALELSPGSRSAVELQRYLIQQITTLFPDLPYTQVAQILSESPTQLVLEDEMGRQYTCSRL
jgi:hypothetical protein